MINFLISQGEVRCGATKDMLGLGCNRPHSIIYNNNTYSFAILNSPNYQLSLKNFTLFIILFLGIFSFHKNISINEIHISLSY